MLHVCIFPVIFFHIRAVWSPECVQSSSDVVFGVVLLLLFFIY